MVPFLRLLNRPYDDNGDPCDYVDMPRGSNVISIIFTRTVHKYNGNHEFGFTYARIEDGQGAVDFVDYIKTQSAEDRKQFDNYQVLEVEIGAVDVDINVNDVNGHILFSRITDIYDDDEWTTLNPNVEVVQSPYDCGYVIRIIRALIGY